MQDIVIIGGGAAGAALFGELLARPHPGTLHWITGSQAPGRGVAYATTDERHLLNVRAGNMGLFEGHTDDFLRHACESLGEVKAADFLPRGLFGDFVQAQVHGRMDQARALGRPFALHADEAVAVQRLAGGHWAVRMAQGRTIRARDVVLAIGTLPQRPLPAVREAALRSGAYLLDPWTLGRRRSAPRAVAVIGTGLTAVDTLLSASHRWPHAELIAVSRHGLLPRAHLPLPSFRYARQEAFNQALLSCRDPLAMLRRFREALEKGADWRALLDGMRPINGRLWQRMSHAGRHQFLRHLRWAWEASRHRMAPATADSIAHLIEEGRLHVHAARVLEVDGEGPLTMTVRDRGTQRRQSWEVDLVIQATGLDTTVRYGAHGLLSQMLADGVATPDPLELGLLADADGRLLDPSGALQPGLYALGALLRGCQWECTAMPEIRSAATGLAARLTRPRPSATLRPMDAGPLDVC